MNGIELLDLDTLNAAYNQRLGMLHSYIRPSIVHNPQTSKTNIARKTLPDKTVDQKIENPKRSTSRNDKAAAPIVKSEEKVKPKEPVIKIKDLVARGKSEGVDLIQFLSEHFAVEEVEL